MADSRIRASVVQACTAAYDLEQTLAKLERLTRLAKERDDADLAVFPEAFIGGYPKMSTFGAVVGERSPEGRDEYLRYFKSAVEVKTGSLAITRMESVARETGVFLVVGVIERDIGTLYCTVVFIAPVVGYVAKHRKLMPTGSERLIWGQGKPFLLVSMYALLHLSGDGSTLPVLEHTFQTANPITTKISAAICWYVPNSILSPG
jgi:predicted amidohydrolase